MDNLGPRLKEIRLSAGMSLRELARQVNISPSFVSQIENGKSQPSVATLYSFAQLLGISVDDLFEGKASARPQVALEDRHDPSNAWQPSERTNRVSITHPSHRSRLEMAAGVNWERLAATPERDVNFMEIVYAPGAESTDSTTTHSGYEYGYVLQGELEITVGSEVFTLQAGESLGFDSSIPHRLRNSGDGEFRGIWFVHGARR